MTSRPARRRARAGSAATTRTADSQASALRETRHRHASETAEDYVEAIAALTASMGEARAVDLARWFGVSHATVIRTISRLQRDGYVSTRPYRAIFLTDHGARVARESRARHDLVVDFLRSLDIPEHVVQSDAEGIEHHVSDETLAAMRRHLERN
jgi:DtxR family transcriptional regulator, manganese transport regulator